MSTIYEVFWVCDFPTARDVECVQPLDTELPGIPTREQCVTAIQDAHPDATNVRPHTLIRHHDGHRFDLGEAS